MNDSVLLSLADKAAREEALDIRESYIVQAPAGSGKTDLLTRRYLKLLAAVDEPEEILAITFTRAATAEMRSRILDDLEAAKTNPASQDERIALARAALTHAERRGWHLLEQPERLDIQTIDSLCLRFAHDQPLLARLGGRLQPTEYAAPLYALAARRTLGSLGSAGTELNDALLGLLQLRDNNLADCERLISDMLTRRDQWAHAFLLSGDIDWDEVRMRLERPFKRAIRRVLAEAYRLLTAEPVITRELFELANYACGNQPKTDIALLSMLKDVPEPDEGLTAHWQCLCNLLLTEKGEWRKQYTVNDGFPPNGVDAKRRKESMLKVLWQMKSAPGLLDLLCEIRNLPPANYSDDQWQTLRRIFTILRHSVAELRVLFAEQNKVDFIEIGIAAQQVLNEPSERALGISERIRHLLVDEFQDTSRRQHQLVSMLVRAWDEGDGRTCFLVGDPMQSIYMFRQAEVELFSQARQHGIVSADQQFACKPLQLSKNFRSHAGLTEPLNDFFAEIFASAERPGAAAVPFSPSFAEQEALPSLSLGVHADFVPTASMGRPSKPDTRAARQREAAKVLGIIEEHLPQIARAKAAGEEYRVAVLVRAKQHLADLIPLLRQAGIPFRGIELETLSERQEILDLLSLTRALLHPMDRIAWLSVLRAPWCGLTLGDLHLLCGSDSRIFQRTSVPELIATRGQLLSSDGRIRLEGTYRVLEHALAARYREAQSLSTWLERTWRTLGGPQCIDAAALANTQVFFQMLDSVSADGVNTAFDAELKRLFAQPDPAASERCGVQLMTIHKAKGLGFDVVIVPGLDRKPKNDSQPLVCSLERAIPGDSSLDEMLVAPIGSKGGTGHPLYKWVQAQKKLRENEERKRIFYVACTRARNELHLLGTAVLGKTSLRPGDENSLLAAAWPALAPLFAQQQPAESVAPDKSHRVPAAGSADRVGCDHRRGSAVDAPPAPAGCGATCGPGRMSQWPAPFPVRRWRMQFPTSALRVRVTSGSQAP